MVGDRDREEGREDEEQDDKRSIVSGFQVVETHIRDLDNGQDLESGKRPK